MLVDFLYGQGPVQSEDKSESGEGMNVMIIIKIKQCCTVQINSYVLNILKTGHYILVPLFKQKINIEYSYLF